MEIELIKDTIFHIRGYRVMLDFHLAELYGVEVKRLNEQVKSIALDEAEPVPDTNCIVSGWGTLTVSN